MNILYQILVIFFLVFMLASSAYLLWKQWAEQRIALRVVYTLSIFSYGALLVQVLINNVSMSAEAPYIKNGGFDHFVYVFLLLLLMAFLILNNDNLKENADPVYKSYFVISVLQQFVLYSWFFTETGFVLAEALPMHVSRLSSIIGLFYLATRNKKLLNVHFYFAIFAMLPFFVMAAINGFDHILGWSFFINHCITLSIPFLGYYATGWLPDKRSIHQAYFYFIIYLIAAHFTNQLTGGNYFYLTDRPIAFLNDWPYVVYIITVLIAIYALFWLGYALFNGFVKLSRRYFEKDLVAKAKPDQN